MSTSGGYRAANLMTSISALDPDLPARRLGCSEPVTRSVGSRRSFRGQRRTHRRAVAAAAPGGHAARTHADNGIARANMPPEMPCALNPFCSGDEQRDEQSRILVATQDYQQRAALAPRLVACQVTPPNHPADGLFLHDAPVGVQRLHQLMSLHSVVCSAHRCRLPRIPQALLSPIPIHFR
jgi:hypothetical protein